MKHTPEEMIHDLQALEEYFNDMSGGCAPVCLSYAVDAIKKLTAYEQEKEDHADTGNRLSCSNCDRFGIDCGSCEAGDID